MIRDARDHLARCHEAPTTGSTRLFGLTELLLEEARSRISLSIDELPVMMWLAAADGYRTHVSSAWREVTGQSVREATGDDWSVCLHPDDIETRLETERAALREGRSFSSTHRLRARDGRYLRVAEVASPRFDDRGQLLGWVGICSPMGYELVEKDLPRVEDAWSLWIHELRSPLHSIIGMADILVRREAELSRDERLSLEAQLLSDARRLDGIVRNVRIVAEAAEWHGKLESVEVRALVEEAVAWHRRQHPESEVRCRFGRVLSPIRVDPVAVGQILNNLLDNAEKYGGASVELVSEQDNQTLAIRVLDRGPGIPPTDLNAIFDWGYRSNGVDGASGNGFGLALSRRLARLMDGDLTATNRRGGGAEFRLTIPVAPYPSEDGKY
jgi:PAS domain S-box-containing protein